VNHLNVILKGLLSFSLLWSRVTLEERPRLESSDDVPTSTISATLQTLRLPNSKSAPTRVILCEFVSRRIPIKWGDLLNINWDGSKRHGSHSHLSWHLEYRYHSHSGKTRHNWNKVSFSQRSSHQITNLLVIIGGYLSGGPFKSCKSLEAKFR